MGNNVSEQGKWLHWGLDERVRDYSNHLREYETLPGLWTIGLLQFF